jgi:hypothetical protein
MKSERFFTAVIVILGGVFSICNQDVEEKDMNLHFDKKDLTLNQREVPILLKY